MGGRRVRGSATPNKEGAMRPLERLVLVGALAVAATVTAAAVATTPGSNGQIAFRRWLNDENSRSALYTINPDGSGVRRIVPRSRRGPRGPPHRAPGGGGVGVSRGSRGR